MAGKARPPKSGAAPVSEDEAKAAFVLLRPKCVDVMQSPSLSTLSALDAELRGLSSLHPHMADYVALPLRILIRKTSRCTHSVPR